MKREYRDKRNVRYYSEWRMAQTVAESLRVQYGPDVRVVGYELGYAVQKYKSGPYWSGSIFC